MGDDVDDVDDVEVDGIACGVVDDFAGACNMKFAGHAQAHWQAS